MIEVVSISSIKRNPNNPRLIKDDKFYKLVESIKQFPEMLNIRPIVVNDDMIVLGGNMRLKASQEAGLTEVPIIRTSLTEQQQKEFIIKDNVGFGEWDWDTIANEWDVEELEQWGLDTPVFKEKEQEEIDTLKNSISIDFELEHMEQASELINFWTEQKLYIGGFLIEKLKAEKEKISL